MTNAYVFQDDETLTDLGGDRAKFNANVEAIQLSKLIVDREATPEERRVLSRYTGWGSTPVLKYAFPPRWGNGDVRDDPISPEMARLNLAEDEIRSLRASSLNAHFTSIPVIRAIWRVLDYLGINKLITPRFLEPSAGVGHFFSAMPVELANNSKKVAVELDKLTAGILRLLHSDVVVHNCGFENAELPGNYFDVILSNIPFGDYPVVDKTFKEKYIKSAIHDYFFARAIHLVSPGGLVVFITSRYTMDKTDNRLRSWIAERADLLGMIRLPNNAFTRNAGTKVVTDIVILRKKDTKPLVGLTNWNEATPQQLMNRNGYAMHVMVNQEYSIHPELVLGKVACVHGMYNDNSYDVEPDGRDIEQAIVDAFVGILPKDVLKYAPKAEQVAAPVARPLFYIPDGASPDQKTRMEALKRIYDTAKKLIAADIAQTESQELRLTLNREYDGFVAIYGCINSPANLKMMKDNPALPFLRALEANYDPTIMGSDKATIFQRSTVRGNLKAQGWEILSPMDRARQALTNSLDKKGAVDIAYMAKISGDTSQGVIEKLTGKIFKTPTGEWETAEEYLSGNVVKKLAEAKAIATIEPEYKLNVAALERIQPEPLGSGDIIARLGASWIPTDVVKQFVGETIAGFHGTVIYMPSISQWKIEVKKGWEFRLSDNDMRVNWGTGRRDAIELLNDAVNMKLPVIRDQVDEEHSVVNQTQTVAAQAKLAEIKDRFTAWVWEDLGRTKLLCDIYNEKFNNLKSRSFDGGHLTLPGFNSGIKLDTHQLNAIWRSVQSKTTLLGHVVGAGKTLIMICSAMELKRLGLANKAIVVVPNHITEQWADEIVRAYPDANVLCASKDDMSKHKRGEFISKIATNAWDIVVIPASSFKLLPVSLNTKIAFLDDELGRLRSALREIKSDGTRKSEKEIEKAIKRAEAELKRLMDMRKDDTATITYEQLGVDLLMVDEFHMYKNLQFVTKMTRVPGLPNTRAERALDMYMKIRWTIGNGGRAVGATGTPVANTLAEVYTMMRYFQFGLLEEQGLDNFDAWAQNFAEVVPSLEMTPDGSGFRMNSRFAKFVNLPELATMWRQCLDVKNAEQLNLPRPKLHSGKSIVVAMPGSDELASYIQELAARADKIKKGEVEPWEDNMLKITGDGRKAALDMRLVAASSHDDPGGKINTCVHNVHRIWEGSEPLKGTQLIFCDLGTPKKIRPVIVEEEGEEEPDVVDVEVDSAVDEKLMNDVYTEIKAKLVKLGIPTGEVAFIHDCKTAMQRRGMFSQVRSGEVRVLIGSTEKMGTGMNVQDKLIALHDLDAPWRPADIEQRHGRMLRRGNSYSEVAIFNYVTEGSFDGYVWQTLETKARFISQIMAGEITARTAEDVGDMVLTMSAVKALASGNPRVMQKVALETELTKLSHLMASWRSNKSNMQFSLVELPGEIAMAKAEHKLHQNFYNTYKSYEGKEFSIELDAKPIRIGEQSTVSRTTYTKREDAGRRIRELAEMAYQTVKHDQLVVVSGHRFFGIGTYKGHELLVKAFANPLVAPEVWPSVGDDMIEYYASKVTDTDAGTMQSLEAYMKSSFARANMAHDRHSALVAKQTQIVAEIEKPWKHAEKYNNMRRQLAIIDLELQADNVAVDTGVERELTGEIEADSVASTFSIVEIMEWLRELHDPNFKVTCDVIAAVPVVELVGPTTAVVVDEVAIAAAEAKINEAQAALIFTELKRTGVKKRAKGYQVPDSQIGFSW